jgi:hypothetical protein
MRLRVGDPMLVPDLLEFLRPRVDAAAEQVGADEVEVSLLGSYAEEPMRMEVYLRVRAWETAHASRGASVELVD